MVLLIAYELQDKTKDVSALHNAIKSAGTWWHHLENVWIIQTDKSAEDWAKKLYKHITKSDHLLVVRVDREMHGWLPERAWEWLDKRRY